MAESEVLFTITRDQLETGLRGFPIGYCTTSSVDPYKGLFYAGYPVADLAYLQPEEVIYLLFHLELPNPDQLADFKNKLVEHSKMNPEIINQLKHLPKEGHPMKWLM